MPINNYSITWLPIERETNLLGLSHCPGKFFTSHMDLSNIKKDGEFINSNGVELIVSLLTDNEIKSLGIQDFESIWTKLNIKNIKFPIRDLSSPRPDQLRTFKELIKIILSFIHKSRPVLIHCNAGLGRSGLVAAVVCKELKIPNAINFVRSNRKGAIENEAQENFIINWKLIKRLS